MAKNRQQLRISIPGLTSKSEKYRPLRNSIEATAEDFRILPEDVAAIVGRFFTHIAHEIAHGAVVRIPSFGMFTAWWSKKWQRAFPRFEPAQGFREILRYAPYEATNNELCSLYRKKHNAARRGSNRGSTTKMNGMAEVAKRANRKIEEDGEASWIKRRQREVREGATRPADGMDRASVKQMEVRE